MFVDPITGLIVIIDGNSTGANQLNKRSAKDIYGAAAHVFRSHPARKSNQSLRSDIYPLLCDRRVSMNWTSRNLTHEGNNLLFHEDASRISSTEYDVELLAP